MGQTSEGDFFSALTRSSNSDSCLRLEPPEPEGPERRTQSTAAALLLLHHHHFNHLFLPSVLSSVLSSAAGVLYSVPPLSPPLPLPLPLALPRSVSSSRVHCHTNCDGRWTHSCRSHLARSTFAQLIYFFFSSLLPLLSRQRWQPTSSRVHGPFQSANISSRPRPHAELFTSEAVRYVGIRPDRPCVDLSSGFVLELHVGPSL